MLTLSVLLLFPFPLIIFFSNRKEFRPAYGKLGSLGSIFFNKPFLALSAIATKATQIKIEEYLGMLKATKILIVGISLFHHHAEETKTIENCYIKAISGPSSL